MPSAEVQTQFYYEFHGGERDGEGAAVLTHGAESCQRAPLYATRAKVEQRDGVEEFIFCMVNLASVLAL